MAEHFVRLLQHCGMPASDVDYVHGNGRVVNKIFREGNLRSTLFTGSQAVAEQLVVDLKGKVTSAPTAPEWPLTSAPLGAAGCAYTRRNYSARRTSHASMQAQSVQTLPWLPRSSSKSFRLLVTLWSYM